MALAIAGATAIIGVSPAPAEGRSLRCNRTTSIGGTSEIRGHPVRGERPVCDRPGDEVDRLEERTAKSKDRGALDLTDHGIGVHDCAAFVGGDDADHLQTAIRVRLRPARRSQPVPLSRVRRRCPGRAASCSVVHPKRSAAAPSTVPSRSSARLARRNSTGSSTEPVCQLVHVRLAGEVVGRRGQGAERAAGERALGGLVVDPLVGHAIGRGDGGRS